MTADNRVLYRTATAGLFAADITLGDGKKVRPAAVYAVPDVVAEAASPVPWDTSKVYPWVIHVEMHLPMIDDPTWSTVIFSTPSPVGPDNPDFEKYARYAVMRAGAHEALEGFGMDPHHTGDEQSTWYQGLLVAPETTRAGYRLLGARHEHQVWLDGYLCGLASRLARLPSQTMLVNPTLTGQAARDQLDRVVDELEAEVTQRGVPLYTMEQRQVEAVTAALVNQLDWYANDFGEPPDGDTIRKTIQAALTGGEACEQD